MKARNLTCIAGSMAALSISLLVFASPNHAETVTMTSLDTDAVVAAAGPTIAVRFAAELGYEVTMVKDATASYSDQEMHSALVVNIPNYASAIVTTDEIVEALSALHPSRNEVRSAGS